MLPIAHRGLWWPDPAKQNTPEAMESAIRSGYGVEIDVHAVPSGLGVGHNCDVLLSLLSSFDCLKDAPLVAWNVKSRGCAIPLIAVMEKFGLLKRSIVFDWELVGDSDLPEKMFVHGAFHECLARASDDKEKEHIADVINKPIHGLWLDAFEDDWVTSKLIAGIKEATDKRTYVVSPELHGRPLDLSLWHEWREADGICTDFPHLLNQMVHYGDTKLYPKEPWW